MWVISDRFRFFRLSELLPLFCSLRLLHKRS